MTKLKMIKSNCLHPYSSLKFCFLTLLAIFDIFVLDIHRLITGQEDQHLFLTRLPTPIDTNFPFSSSQKITILITQDFRLLGVFASYHHCNSMPQTSSLNGYKFITYILQVRSKKVSLAGLESRCQWCWFLLEALGENLLPCVFQFLEASGMSAGVPFLYLPPSQETPYLSDSLALYLQIPSLALTLLPLSYKESCDYIGLTSIISQLKTPNLITSTSLCKSVYSQVPWPNTLGSYRYFLQTNHKGYYDYVFIP